jgi:hypothetical protein
VGLYFFFIWRAVNSLADYSAAAALQTGNAARGRSLRRPGRRRRGMRRRHSADLAARSADLAGLGRHSLDVRTCSHPPPCLCHVCSKFLPRDCTPSTDSFLAQYAFSCRAQAILCGRF